MFAFRTKKLETICLLWWRLHW